MTKKLTNEKFYLAFLVPLAILTVIIITPLTAFNDEYASLSRSISVLALNLKPISTPLIIVITCFMAIFSLSWYSVAYVSKKAKTPASRLLLKMLDVMAVLTCAFVQTELWFFRDKSLSSYYLLTDFATIMNHVFLFFSIFLCARAGTVTYDVVIHRGDMSNRKNSRLFKKMAMIISAVISLLVAVAVMCFYKGEPFWASNVGLVWTSVILTVISSIIEVKKTIK